MGSDERVRALGALLSGLGASEDSLGKLLHDAAEVSNFLDDPSVSVLQAILMKDGSVELSNTLRAAPPGDCEREVHLLKLRPEALGAGDIVSGVQVASVERSPIASLYNVLRQVYNPTLLRNSEYSGKLDGKLQSLLADLEAGLKDVVADGAADGAEDGGRDGDRDEASVAGIVTPQDEFGFWDRYRGRRVDREAVRSFRGVFGRLAAFEEVERLGYSELEELVEEANGALEDVWRVEGRGGRPAYPQARMRRLMEVIGAALCRSVSSKLRPLDLWEGPFAEVDASLEAAEGVIRRWLDVPRQLTEQLWQNWEGGAFEDRSTAAFAERLESIRGTREQHEELKRLLSAAEASQLRLDDVLRESFSSVRPLLCNPYTQRDWEDAQRTFEARLLPADAAIAQTIRRRTAARGGSAELLLRELQRYHKCIARPGVASALSAEREALLAELAELVDAVDGEIDHEEEDAPALYGMELLSPRVRGVARCEQLSRRLRCVALPATRRVLGDLAGFEGLQRQAEAALRRVGARAEDLFRAWTEDVRDALADGGGELSLNGADKLMEVDREGILVVNYSESLVRLIREVRQLRELGRKVPRDVVGVAEDGERYYRFGVMLKKVANFYNSLGTEILEDQKPMLLDSLLAFEQVVLQQSQTRGPSSGGGRAEITWGSPEECSNYVQRLQEAAVRLDRENRRLRKLHAGVGRRVVALMNVDRLRQNDLWKNKWQALKEHCDSLSGKYRNMERWLLHWDHQLYKAVEAGYQMGLESLNEHLPEIRADLELSGRRLAFKPPLEDLRLAYYRKLRNFVGIPFKFGGLRGDAGGAVFTPMVARNAASLLRVYEKGEALFLRLEQLLLTHGKWAALSVGEDLDALVDEHCSEPAHFSGAFKMLAARRKECDRLPDAARVDCVRVSLVPLKVGVADGLQKLCDAVLVGLRRLTLARFREVDAFLEGARLRFGKPPISVEEIAQAKQEWRELDQGQHAMKAQSDECVRLKALLLQHAPGTEVDVEEVASRMAGLEGESGRWADFEVDLEAFNTIMDQQQEKLKGVLAEEVVAANEDIARFHQRWSALKPSEMARWDNDAIQAVFASLSQFREGFEDLQRRAGALAENCANFGVAAPRFDGLPALEEDLAATMGSWDMLKDFSDEERELGAGDWITFRANVFALQDFGTRWAERLGERYKDRSHDIVTEHLQAKVDGIKRAMPVLKYCRGDPFKEEHWTSLLQGKLGMPRGVRLENLTAQHFIDALDRLAEPGLLKYVKHLNAQAQGEVTIREALQELVAWSQTAELSLLEHEENGRRTPLIRDWKDLFLELGDKQSLLASLKESPFFRPFADQGATYEHKLGALDVCLHTLNSIQRKWVYLEPIFGRGALPGEQQRFRRVDDEFRDIMDRVEREPKVFNLADEMIFPGLGDSLRMQLDQLERCQKALADFLEEKRNAMPRFFFIGDDDLLEILGQSQNPNVIQAHLKKLFQGVNRVDFDGDMREIVAMRSAAGELVRLEQPVRLSDRVEDWLNAFVDEMRSSLAAQLRRCVSSELDFEAFASQVLCLAKNVAFAREAEAAIEDGALDALHGDLRDTLQRYTSQDLSGRPLLSLKMKALVLDLIHNMDVVDQLRAAGVRSTDDWAWQKQIKPYLRPSGRAEVVMYNAAFDYTYEYQGNAPKLVHTPLTDKCYLTLTQAMKNGFGGNPYGPAGTGKTESVKALSALYGRMCIVQNCDEALDFKALGKMLIGVVKCGAWSCFDEFNRLKEDQLSAASQQIQVIQDAIKQKQRTIHLLGRTVDVDFNAGIFVTLNPAGKDYGGRSRLPDNLKALFRPVAMGRPDNEIIAEVILYSEGFFSAKELASKVVSIFQLSKQLLSEQRHYDWGLRALKAVLNTGGKFITKMRRSGESLDGTREAEVLIKAVRVNTLSKLTYGDTHLFLGLIGDIFPGVESADMSGGELEKAIREVMVAKPFFLEEDEAQIRKMLQLKEALDQRMGCVVVGPSGCGKTAVWRVLQAAIERCGQRIVVHVMNPKSMRRERLLGQMDLDTREWTDGVLTQAARTVVREPPEVRSWIVCDGDVDPEWIEALNSVLDDNHLLTLPNGERIAFGPNVNFLFETHDLRFASPATVSRMGMIFLSDDDMDVRRVVNKWLSSQEEGLRMQLSGWIDELFFKALDHVRALESVVETTLVGTVLNGLAQVSGAEKRGAFICGLVRGLGGNLALADRSTFAKQVFQWAGERPADMGAPLDSYFDGGGFSGYTTDRETYDNRDRAADARDLSNGSAVVPTVSVKRCVDMMRPWIEACEPFILVGPEGCGKHMMIAHAFAQRRGTSVTTLHCNAQTTAEHVITKVAQTCSLFSSPEGRVYRPRDAERLVLYLKDINLPRPDMYDTCMLIAFLQQLVTYGGFYDENLEFLRIERVQIVASMNAATTLGRHALSTRFTAIVRIGTVDYPERSELAAVYDTFLDLAFRAAGDGLDARWSRASERTRLAGLMVDVYDAVRAKFRLEDARHYLFTPRDLTAWVEGLLRYDLAREDFADVFAHEAARLFRDRLVDADAQNRYDALVNALLRAHFKQTPSLAGAYFTALADGGARAKAGGGDTLLERVAEEDFRGAVRQGIVYYEREEKDLHLLLFPELLEHVAQVDRVLSRPNGHLFLAGSSGVGRRSAVTLAAYMLGMQLVEPAVTRDFGMKDFGAELKSAMQRAGVDGERTVLYLEDHMFTSSAILETVNSLLSASEVPGLYTHEELEPLLAPLKEKMMEEGSHRTPYDFFVSRVRKYLHVCVAMDPLHPAYAARCESNPALHSKCSVLWMGAWRRSTMRSVPMMMEPVRELLTGRIREAEDEEDGKDEGKRPEGKEDYGDGRGGGGGGGKRAESKLDDDSDDDLDDLGALESAVPDRSEELLKALLSIHESVKEESAASASPRHYMRLLRGWRALYDMQRRAVRGELRHLLGGLGKLEEASRTVDELSRDAAVQQSELKVAQDAANEAMEMITKALAEATDRRKDVEELRAITTEAEEKTKVRKADIEEELSQINPILEAAKQAVGQIRSEHLNEIRSLKMPPEQIADVLSAVLMLLGIHDHSWLSMKRFLGGRGVKDQILNFDGRAISNDTRKDVLRLLKQKQASFEHANIYRVSVAAAPLAGWVKANIRYSMVIEKIRPLDDELAAAVSDLEGSQRRLEQCQSELDEIDARVQRLQQDFQRRTGEAAVLANGLEAAQRTLDKAQSLLSQLGGEEERWKAQSATLRDKLATLPRQALLAAAFGTYLTPFPEDVRERMLGLWGESLGAPRFSYKRLLSSESELLQWKAGGLPADDLSQENALAIDRARSGVPFIIDPASVCVDWLRARLAGDKLSPLEAVPSNSPRFVNQVELCVRFGKTLLLLEVDRLEPMLYPLARGDLLSAGPRQSVRVGDKVVDYSDAFRMLLVTRSPTPDLPPDAAALLRVVNFSVTRSGLENQLLQATIQAEEPELERAKSEMLRQEEDSKVQLAGLERQLLEELATAEGDLLENTALLDSLRGTKAKSADIAAALRRQREASERLDAQREVYRPFATRGAKLYFLLEQMAQVNSVYVFGLSEFRGHFTRVLEAEDAGGAPTDRRLERLGAALQQAVYAFAARAMFKRDRLLFALHLVRGMQPELFLPDEWALFCGDLAPPDRPSPVPRWAPQDAQAPLGALRAHLPALAEALSLDAPGWSRFAASPEAERDLPSLRGVSSWQKVLAVQALRPDRLRSAIDLFCAEALALPSLAPGALSQEELYAASAGGRPVLFLCTEGNAPAGAEAFARTLPGGAARYRELSLGGGQEELALSTLRDAARDGGFVVFKNLHLLVHLLPRLEEFLNTAERIHADFRLWLTSEAHPAIPNSLLKAAVKVSTEADPGLKKRVRRCLAAFPSDGAPDDLARLRFMACCFHAELSERVKFVPHGYVRPIAFGASDLKAALMTLDALHGASGAAGVDYEKLRGLLMLAIYGPRVEAIADLRVVQAYVDRAFTSDAFEGRQRIGAIRVPPSGAPKDLLDAADVLPEEDSPQLFGLPQSIGGLAQRNASQAIARRLKDMGDAAAQAPGAAGDPAAVSFTQLRAHETAVRIAYGGLCV